MNGTYQPSQARAGTLSIDQGEAVRRIAALLLADPGMPLEAAWGLVTRGMYLGTWRKTIGVAVVGELARIGRAAQ